MKKFKLSVAVILAMATLMPLQSCIGSFALTNRVLSWNKQVGSKFINELVFFAFWVLPVYEVTSVADLIVLNSIEFWSGNNPVDQASTKVVETEAGTYYIACDTKGYTIKSPDGNEVRFDFEEENQTWSILTKDGVSYPFMTMIDDSHVKMLCPDGDFRMVDLSEQGVMAYAERCGGNNPELL